MMKILLRVVLVILSAVLLVSCRPQTMAGVVVPTIGNDEYVRVSDTDIAEDGASVESKRDFDEREHFLDRLAYSINLNLIEEDRWKLMADGLWMTIKLSFFSILTSILAGAGLCAMRMSKRKFVYKTAFVYIETVRSLPLLIILMLLLYVIFAQYEMNPALVGIIGFALYFGAYFSESFRSGIETVDSGQWEAGYALGFNKVKTFFKVILPQATLTIIPVFKGLMTSLIKSTSIVGYISIFDMTRASDLIRSRTFDAFFPLLLSAVLYLVITWVFGSVLIILEKRLTPKHRSI